MDPLGHKLITSEERVGDAYEPKTKATLEAIDLCKIRREPVCRADRVAPVVRSSYVQMGSFIERAIDILLLGEETAEMAARRLTREQIEATAKQNHYASNKRKRKAIKAV